MALGVIFGETSTREFSFLFGDPQGQGQHQLKYAYVQINLDNENRVVARVVDVNTENPLLGRDTAKFYSESEATGLRFPDLMSRRFTLYQAKCEVIGRYNSRSQKIESLTQPINPGQPVETLDPAVLNQLLSEDNPWHLHLGYVETPSGQTQAQVSLNADSILTMHACVFGMTGMGKTTTTAVLLEDLMFRGAKTIVFDPHSDYVNINQISQDLYNRFFRDSVENDEAVMRQISVYSRYLRRIRSNRNQPDRIQPWNDFDPSFDTDPNERDDTELTTENIFYRLLNFCSIRDRRLMIDSMQTPDELRPKIDDIITKIRDINLREDLPRELASRKLTIEFNAFPTLRVYPDRSPYFTMRLIEAIAGEGFTPAQEGHMIEWLSDLQSRNQLDDGLLNFLRGRIQGLRPWGNGRPDPSQAPLNRIIDKAMRTIRSLRQRGCRSLDVNDFVTAFCSRDGNLSDVSTAVFNLSDLESNHVRRALIYAVMEFAFDRYKSRHLVMGENAHPVLFAIEEARTLIPREEESSTSGEMHPATRAARLAARQIATEGRKMGLGMLVISQKPASVDSLTVSQANTLILHRAINPDDQNYIRNVGESLSIEDLETLKTVKEGVAIVTGDALKTRIMSTLVKVRNRYSEPGTEKPRPIETLWTNQ